MHDLNDDDFSYIDNDDMIAAPSLDVNMSKKVSREGVSKTYVILRVRPGVVNLYIAPFYYICLIKLMQVKLKLNLKNETYKQLGDKMQIMKIDTKLCISIRLDPKHDYPENYETLRKYVLSLENQLSNLLSSK